MKKLYIALDGGKKLSLGDLDTFTGKNFRLRTVDRNQYQARISMGINENDRDYSLHSVFLEGLKSSSNGYSYLDCSIEARGRKLYLLIKNASRTVWQESFSLIPLRKRINLLLIILGTLVLTGGLIAALLLVDFSSGPEKPREISQGTARESTPVSTPVPVTTEKTSPDRAVTEKSVDRENINGEPTPEATMAGDRAVPAQDRDSSGENVETAVEIEPAVVVEKEPEAKTVRVDFTRLSPDDLILHFTPNSAVIDGHAEKSLTNILSFLLEYPRLSVKITGHCAIAGTEAGRREISVLRAQNVYSWLTDRGWQPETSPLVTGEAGDHPLTRDPEKQDINRRVEITLSE